jgi:hypothetical protein
METGLMAAAASLSVNPTDCKKGLQSTDQA